MELNELENAVVEWASETLNDFAIAICGPWGSGKTFFWKQELVPALQNSDYIPIYVSLYGLSNTDEVRLSLLSASVPFGKGTWKKSLPRWLSALAGYFKLREFVGVIDISKIIDSSKSVICFDDYERYSGDRNDLFGMMNGLVEHDGFKVVLIGNEEMIDDPNYKSYREKLIGHTFKFHFDAERILGNIISGMETGSYINQRIQSDRNVIAELCIASELSNARILRRVIMRYCRILGIVSRDNIDSPYLVYLLRMIFGLVQDIDKGVADLETLNVVFKKKDGLVHILIAKESAAKDYIEKFIARYFEGKTDDVPFLSSVYDYIVDGILDKSKVKNELGDLLTPVEAPSKSADELLFSEFWKLKQEDFEEVSNRHLDKLLSGEIRQPNKILRYYQTFHHLAESGLLSLNSQELCDRSIAVISELYTNDKVKCGDLKHADSFLFFGESGNVTYTNFRNKLLELDQKICEEEYESEAKQLLGIIGSDISEFVEKISGEEKSEWMTRPLFCYGDPDELSKMISTLDQDEIIKLRNAISYRYERISNISDFLSQEKDVICELKDRISKQLPSENMSIQEHVLHVLAQTLDKACVTLSK